MLPLRRLRERRRKQKTEADQQLADLRKKLRSAQLATLYQHGSVYPSGLGTVRMGMSISKVREAFDRKTIEEKDSYLSVQTGHAVFRDVTYYFGEADKDQIITHVSFRYDEGDKDLVQSKLVEALGPPSNIPKAGYFEWSRGEVGVFHHSGFMSSVIVMNSQWRPGYWPEGKGK